MWVNEGAVGKLGRVYYRLYPIPVRIVGYRQEEVRKCNKGDCYMRRQEIFFATSNKKKFESLSKILAPIGVELKQLEYDFDEGRDLTIETITQSKLKQAKEAFPDKKLIVDDRGFLFQH